MNKTAFFAAAIVGMSALSGSAFAQSKTVVPGNQVGKTSEVTGQGAMKSDTGTTGMDAPVANSSQETIVPGNTQEIQNNDAEVRKSVAAGTDAMAPANGDASAVQPSAAGAPGNAEDMSKPNTSATEELNKPKTMQK